MSMPAALAACQIVAPSGAVTSRPSIVNVTVPEGTPLWAQIAPGNAASVRAFLAAGFRPVGAEALLPLA